LVLMESRRGTWVSHVQQGARRAVTPVSTFVLCAIAAAIIALPVALERAIQNVQFSDRLGTFPVEVSLCHDGQSTLDTGVLGKVYWDETGRLGFGAYARATGPPEAGGTLASYVDPTFIQANVAFVDDPNVVVDAYADKFVDGLRDRIVRDELLAALVGGAVLMAVVPRRRLREAPAARIALVSGLLVLAATGVSALVATQMFDEWPCSEQVTSSYAMPGVDKLSFASPETLEVARQVKPFIDKNTERLEERAQEYEDAADASFAAELADHRFDLAPRADEVIVLAEADTQGSLVGADVRTKMYRALVDQLGRGSIAIRTISGDVSSNGTVGEASYIATEADVSGDIPTVAVGGDHDSETTWQQMSDDGIDVVDMDTTEVDGLRISGVNDVEHKTLFGGLVTNSSGVTEEELGVELRESIDDVAQIVLFHQPDAAAGFLGLGSLDPLRQLHGSLTVPYDDGIPDQVPGIVSIGHRHILEGPWVLWNTGGDQVTWTVVDQLGTAGGVENVPTFNRFSTPNSVPLKDLTVRLQYVNTDSGLETGYATVSCGLDGTCEIADRVDVGIPGGQPLDLSDQNAQLDR
jgi:hypothetical protein